MPLTYHINDLFNTPMSGSDDVFDGGNKTGANPTTWGWKYGGALNKDEMNNVNLHFSEDKATDEAWVVVSGDRYTTNGTSYIDFEFYQNRIRPSSSRRGEWLFHNFRYSLRSNARRFIGNGRVYQWRES